MQISQALVKQVSGLFAGGGFMTFVRNLRVKCNPVKIVPSSGPFRGLRNYPHNGLSIVSLKKFNIKASFMDVPR